MKVLIIDNYDSFTYNLFHLVEQFDVGVDVIRNDALDLTAIEKYDKIILSPGPGLPKETKMMFEVLDKFSATKPILGVCLGMQGISEFFGCRLQNQKEVKHGVKMQVNNYVNSKLFDGIPDQFEVGLYHSWCVDINSISSEILVAAMSSEGVVMAVQHQWLPVVGIQFHPESIMSDWGFEIISNFLKY